MNRAHKTDVDIALAREAVRKRLSAKSAAHCLRTAETARGLALCHGVDSDAAELAGLLHDWSRDESLEDLLAFATHARMHVLPEEREHPYLLHARVACERLREAFPGISREVLEAVAAHTVGSVPMTDLDKVVFIADMIEPARTFAGVDRLRDIAETHPLREVFREAYAQSVGHVIARGAPLHPTTHKVIAAIESETGRPLPEATVAKP